MIWVWKATEAALAVALFLLAGTVLPVVGDWCGRQADRWLP